MKTKYLFPAMIFFIICNFCNEQFIFGGVAYKNTIGKKNSKNPEKTEAFGPDSTLNANIDTTLAKKDKSFSTGLINSTPVRKIGFSTDKIEEKAISNVPAFNVAEALRGKVPGLKIIHPSGNPSLLSEIRLRSSVSISGELTPLILMDGKITSGNFNDICMEDVESIEVIKSTAGAAIYGSRGGNGIVNIITKRGGSITGDKDIQITIRNEFGQSSFKKEYPLTNNHFWKANSSGWITDALGNRVYDIEYINPDPTWTFTDSAALINQRLINDNDYWTTYDNAGGIFNNESFSSNYISIASKLDKLNIFTSFQNYNEGSVLHRQGNLKRKNARLNIDIKPHKQWNISFSGNYTNTNDLPLDYGFGNEESRIMRNALLTEPHMNIFEEHYGEFTISTPSDPFISYYEMLYKAYLIKRERERKRDRFMGSGTVSFNPYPWLNLNAEFSRDQTNYFNQDYYPVDDRVNYKGSLYITRGEWKLNTLSTSANINKSFYDFDYNIGFKWLFEDFYSDYLYGGGNDFLTEGVIRLSHIDPDTRVVNSELTRKKAENIILNFFVGYKDKFFLDAAFIREGASQFGTGQKYQSYQRYAISYIITEDISIPHIDYAQLRLNYGTSGLRPPWNAKYETVNVSMYSTELNVLGNENLKPAKVKSTELGLSAGFLKKYLFELNYAKTEASDQIILCPLSPATGYESQWRNAGTTSGSSVEFSLGGEVLNKGNFKWDFSLVGDLVKQEITYLDRTPWTEITGSVSIYRFEENTPYGVMYGNLLCRSLNDLTLDENEYVINDYQYSTSYDPSDPLFDPYTDKNHVLSDFKVNEDGFVVLAETENTRAEQVYFKVDTSGVPIVGKIGDSNPDFCFGISNTFFYKAFTLYVLLEGQKGGDIYNYTKQLLYFNERHGDFDTYAEMGKSADYNNGSSMLYNNSDPNDYFVEDGSYLKIREIALSYTLKGSKLKLDFLEDAKISLIGRNVLTLTKYTGFDPELAYHTNPTNFRIDDFNSPNYKTWSVALMFRF